MVRRYLALYRRLAAPAHRASVVSLHTLDQLESLGDEWTGLCRDDPHSTPFQYPQWLVPWCRHVSSGVVAGAALRKAGMLRAVALAIRENGTVRLLGDGASDYLGIAARSAADTREVLAPLLDGACGVELAHLPSGSPLLSLPLGPIRQVHELDLGARDRNRRGLPGTFARAPGNSLPSLEGLSLPATPARASRTAPDRL